MAFWVSVQAMTDLTEAETEEFCKPLRKFTQNQFAKNTSAGFGFFTDMNALFNESDTSPYQISIIQRAVFDLDKMKKGSTGRFGAKQGLHHLISSLNPKANIPKGDKVADLQKHAIKAMVSFAQAKIRKELAALIKPLGPESKA